MLFFKFYLTNVSRFPSIWRWCSKLQNVDWKYRREGRGCVWPKSEFQIWSFRGLRSGPCPCRYLNHLRVICHHFCCPMSLLWASSIHDQIGDIGIMRQLGFNYPVWSSLQTSQQREVEKLGLHRHKPGKAQWKFESADEYQWQERLRTCKKKTTPDANKTLWLVKRRMGIAKFKCSNPVQPNFLRFLFTILKVASARHNCDDLLLYA